MVHGWNSLQALSSSRKWVPPPPLPGRHCQHPQLGQEEQVPLRLASLLLRRHQLKQLELPQHSPLCPLLQGERPKVKSHLQLAFRLQPSLRPQEGVLLSHHLFHLGQAGQGLLPPLLPQELESLQKSSRRQVRLARKYILGFGFHTSTGAVSVGFSSSDPSASGAAESSTVLTGSS